MFNILPDHCLRCRAKYADSNRTPPCDNDDICGVTGFNIYDEDRFMVPDLIVGLIAEMWKEIILISPRQVYEIKNKNGSTTYNLYTIQLIDGYLRSIEWHDYPINIKQAYHLIKKFHITYINGIMSSG